jgi:hypothetical protein
MERQAQGDSGVENSYSRSTHRNQAKTIGQAVRRYLVNPGSQARRGSVFWMNRHSPLGWPGTHFFEANDMNAGYAPEQPDEERSDRD